MGKSLNQAKQFFCATSYGKLASGKVLDASNNETPGTIFAKASADGEDLVLRFIDAKGEQTRSDIINVKNILWVKAKKKEDDRDYINTWTITLDSNVNSGAPISGENYILNIETSGYYDNSDVNKYVKHGVVRGISGMTASNFYKKLAISIAKNFSREVDVPIKVFLGVTEVTAETKESALTSTYSSVTIKEAEPYWRDNSFEYRRFRISIATNKVNDNGQEVLWATITKAVSTTEYFGNGKKTAELEQFCKSMASDYYIHGITTPLSPEMLVNPSSEYNYLTIHHCHVGSNEGAQRSEKDIVVVSTTTTAIDNIIDVINSATGKSYAKLVVQQQGGQGGQGGS